MYYKLSPENAIEIKNVSKTFRVEHEKVNSVFEYLASLHRRRENFEDLYVLKDISFSVKKGEMLGIIGLNGSGKTTLLKILAKIARPDEGEVEVNGRVTPFLELGTGFNGDLTARDNIILYGVILGLGKREIVKKIEEIAKFSELEKFLDTKLKNFSSGMNARLAFSTAMQVDPDILLVDEVLAVGDEPFKQKSYDVFLSFKKRKKTILYVSHTMEQIQQLCDNALLIHKGRIRAYGKPQDVINVYRDLIKGEADDEIRAQSPWFHDFSKLGMRLDPSCFKSNQLSLKNQEYKEPIISKFLSVAFKDLRKKKPSMLEMFCSDGYFSMYAMETFHTSRVVMVDKDEKMIKRAKLMSQKLRLDGIEFRVQDVKSLNENERFDIVLNAGGLPVVEDPQKVIELTHKITNRYAIIQSVTTLESEDENYIKKSDGVSRFTDARLKKWIGELDWKIVSHERNVFEHIPEQSNRGSSYFLCKKN